MKQKKKTTVTETETKNNKKIHPNKYLQHSISYVSLWRVFSSSFFGFDPVLLVFHFHAMLLWQHFVLFSPSFSIQYNWRHLQWYTIHIHTVVRCSRINSWNISEYFGKYVTSKHTVKILMLCGCVCGEHLHCLCLCFFFVFSVSLDLFYCWCCCC